MSVPSGPNLAQGSRGAVLTKEQLSRYYTQGDRLADEAVAALWRLPKSRRGRVYDKVLHGVLPAEHVPSEVHELFAQAEMVPPWVNWDQLTLGGAAYRRCGVLGGWILACCALPLSYSLAGGNKPLVYSGNLGRRTRTRLTETARFVRACCEPDELRAHRLAWRFTVRVRFMHARVRRLLKEESHAWDPDWGEPINQVYMAHTNLVFSVSHLGHLRRLGFIFSPAEADAVMHLWRYSGYLMGIEPELLCATEDGGRRLMRLIDSDHVAPDADSRKLSKVLMEEGLPQLILARFPASARIQAWLIRSCYGISHSLLGRRLARGLGYPSTASRHFARLLAWGLVTPLEAARRLLPGLHDRVVALGTKSIDRCLWANPGEAMPAFALPEKLEAVPVQPPDFRVTPARPSPRVRRSLPAMTEKNFQFLTAEDVHRLLDNAPEVDYHRGDEIMTEGRPVSQLFLIRAGFVRVEHSAQGKGIAVARLGPGEVLGEMGFLEGTGATASVIADEDVTAQVLDAARLSELLNKNTGLASRFYQWLAITMAQRLRKTTHDWATSVAQQQKVWRRFHLDRTLQLSAEQIPRQLAEGVATFQQTLQTVERGLTEGQLQAEAAQARISAACDFLRGLVERFTREADLVQMAYDAGKLSGPRELAEGIGLYILRQIYPSLMTSATMARCYTKPRGYPEDPETRERMYLFEEKKQGEGDPPLGAYLDFWFLSGPVSAARRQGRKQIAAQLAREAATAASTGPLRITSLGCGGAEELFDFLEENRAEVYITGVDADTDALQATADVVKQLHYEKQITLVRADVLGLIGGRGAVSVAEQHVISAQGLGDYLDDEQFANLLNWSYERLRTGGVLLLAGLDLTDADRAFLQHILEWEVHPRSEARLRELVAKSHFKERPLEIVTGNGGAFLLARK